MDTSDKRAGGWHALASVERILVEEHALARGTAALLYQNKPDGFACVSCAWAKPAQPRKAEFCENGAKATAWEITSKRVAPEFFAQHAVSELAQWSDHELEKAGRLTTPLRFDTATGHYVAVSWEEAFAEIGRELRQVRSLDPRGTVFYASGRASLEASYLYQLLARLYGNNNLPDSSNMCHESTSVALPQSIGVPIGTVRLEDFERVDAIFFFGQNAGVNSPRMLHPLKEARERGVPIVTFNPLRERGLVAFADPQSPLQMLTPAATPMSTQYLQVRIDGDRAAITGVCKAILGEHSHAIDRAFIAEHTHGFEEFAAFVRATQWEEIEQQSGLARADLQQAARVYAAAPSIIGVYGMGLTQHAKGVLNVRLLVNLLLLGGHIGRPGAGICPVRGHSNVQGQRTVGITEKPELAPLDKLAELYHFTPPREKGHTTVEACQAIIEGKTEGFVGLGGNFLRAAPDSARLEQAWRRVHLTVHIATKLNRSHVLPGEVSYVLPCLGRIEKDLQASGEQSVTIEDSTAIFHASHGVTAPAAESLRSEVAIIAGIAEAALDPNPRVPWREWVADYGRIRDAIAVTWPDIFHDFNERRRAPEGFAKVVAARERKWHTPSGKAEFVIPDSIRAPREQDAHSDVFTLMTIRSDNQFNTTIYYEHDHYRSQDNRRVVLMNEADMQRLNLSKGTAVTLVTTIDPQRRREVGALHVVPYSIPQGCIAGYYPECNPLVPVSHYAEGSKVPAYKSIPVRVIPAGATI